MDPNEIVWTECVLFMSRAGSCADDNEQSGSIKSGEIWTSLATISFKELCLVAVLEHSVRPLRWLYFGNVNFLAQFVWNKTRYFMYEQQRNVSSRSYASFS
jgi:hypothetical protein